MKILLFIVPLATLLVIICGVGFFWAVRGRQFDDMEGPAHQILFDDDDPNIPHGVIDYSIDPVQENPNRLTPPPSSDFPKKE